MKKGLEADSNPKLLETCAISYIPILSILGSMVKPPSQVVIAAAPG